MRAVVFVRCKRRDVDQPSNAIIRARRRDDANLAAWTFVELTERRGWSGDEWRAWLGRVLRAELLGATS